MEDEHTTECCCFFIRKLSGEVSMVSVQDGGLRVQSNLPLFLHKSLCRPENTENEIKNSPQLWKTKKGDSRRTPWNAENRGLHWRKKPQTKRLLREGSCKRWQQHWGPQVWRRQTLEAGEHPAHSLPSPPCPLPPAQGPGRRNKKLFLEVGKRWRKSGWRDTEVSAPGTMVSSGQSSVHLFCHSKTNPEPQSSSSQKQMQPFLGLKENFCYKDARDSSNI